MASIVTNYITEYDVSVRARMNYEFTQDVIANTSLLTYSVVSENNPTGFHRTGAKSIVEVDGKVKTGASKTAYNGTTLDSGSFVIEHESDGTKTISISVTLNIQGTTRTASTTLVLPSIPRGHTFTLNETMLSSGGIAELKAVKNVSTYTATISWNNGVNSGIIARRSSETEWQIPYSTISVGIDSGLTKNCVITCETYNGTALVSSIDLSIAINTGNIVMSLYDDGNGNLGARFGKKAEGSGWYFPLQDAIKVIESTHDYTLSSSKTYGTVSWEVPIPIGYKIIGICGCSTGNVVTAIAGFWGIEMANGNYRVSIRYVLNYSTQSGTQHASANLLAVYVGE